MACWIYNNLIDTIINNRDEGLIDELEAVRKEIKETNKQIKYLWQSLDEMKLNNKKKVKK